MEVHELELETTAELTQAIAYLEDIVAGLKSGRICVQHEEDELLLSPQRTVSVALKAKQKEDKETISLKISWEMPKAMDNGHPPLRITTTPERRQ